MCIRDRGCSKHFNRFGYEQFKIYQTGKFFEIEIEEKDEKKAEQKVEEMCNKLLVNLIIEDYRISKI